MSINPLFKIQSGLYIVSTKFEEKLNGCVINTGMQVTAEPEKISVTISKDNLTCSLIEKSGFFNLSVLSEKTDIKSIGKFGYKSGKDIEKYADINFKTDLNLIPYPVDNICAYISCKVDDVFDVGTHMMFIGIVNGGETLSDEKPLTYSYYHEVLKGKSPKNAPTFNI